jgi:hypothetical protein
MTAEIVKCTACGKVLAMISKGKFRTGERVYCSTCYDRRGNDKYRYAGESMGERDALDQLKGIFGME